MIRRPLRPSFGYEAELRLLKNMGTVRHLAIMWGSAAGFGSKQHQLADDLKVAIDAMGTALTGDPTYLHAKPHG